jgi:hypothetical protein
MSDADASAFPVIFGVDDTGFEGAEVAERAEGMAPPLPEVAVPHIAGAAAEPAAVGYPLIDFPWEPWALTCYGELTQSAAEGWAAWLSGIEPSRVALFRSVLADAGAPVAALSDDLGALDRLGAWIQNWFSLVAEPYVSLQLAPRPDHRYGFFQDQPDMRLGGARAPLQPGHAGYSRSGDALLHTVAVDLAVLIIDAARASRPGLRWTAGFDADPAVYYLTPDPQLPAFDLIRQTREFCVQAVARPRTRRGHQLREWRGHTLSRLYQWAATGVAQKPEYEAFPGAQGSRAGARYQMWLPGRETPPSLAHLVEAVATLREAGWFEACTVYGMTRQRFLARGPARRLSDADLAASARAAWQAHELEDIPLDATEMFWRLLLLDDGRTWSEEIDAGIRPTDHIHDQTLTALTDLAGKEFASLQDWEEHWTDAGDGVLSFRLRRRQQQIVLPAPGRYLSPALITGLNDLIAQDRPRFWFVDRGGPVAIVTRATAGERDVLQRLTGLRLDSEPPAWWTEAIAATQPDSPQG